MTENVYLFETWMAQPKYHDYGRIKELGSETTGDVTKCGLVMYANGATYYQALLRRDHADLFAVPCKRCFPEQNDD